MKRRRSGFCEKKPQKYVEIAAIWQPSSAWSCRASSINERSRAAQSDRRRFSKNLPIATHSSPISMPNANAHGGVLAKRDAEIKLKQLRSTSSRTRWRR